jgi:branched-chain amino acid transport system ATP-binding protein
MILLEVKNLDVSYGPVAALRNMSLVVQPGEVVLVVGANGAGKSTLLNAISGGVKATAGRVMLQEADLTKFKSHEIARRGIAHVPEGRGVLGELTVRENLLLGSYCGASSRGTVNMDEVLDFFPRLRERLEQPAVMLSGGEQQMLAIARGLLSSPRVLLIDELSLGLAPAITREILGLMSTIKRNGIGILIVEQNVKEAIKVADRTYVLANGACVHATQPGEQVDVDTLLNAYLAA